MIYTATIPVGPSTNQMYIKAHRNSKFGKTLSPTFKAWTKLVAPMLLEAWEDQDRPSIGKPWSLYLRLGVNHQSDIANREKAITDMLVKAIPGFPDDAWMNRLVIERGGEAGMAEIEVCTLP